MHTVIDEFQVASDGVGSEHRRRRDKLHEKKCYTRTGWKKTSNTSHRHMNIEGLREGV